MPKHKPKRFVFLRRIVFGGLLSLCLIFFVAGKFAKPLSTWACNAYLNQADLSVEGVKFNRMEWGRIDFEIATIRGHAWTLQNLSGVLQFQPKQLWESQTLEWISIREGRLELDLARDSAPSPTPSESLNSGARDPIVPSSWIRDLLGRIPCTGIDISQLEVDLGLRDLSTIQVIQLSGLIDLSRGIPNFHATIRSKGDRLRLHGTLLSSGTLTSVGTFESQLPQLLLDDVLQIASLKTIPKAIENLELTSNLSVQFNISGSVDEPEKLDARVAIEAGALSFEQDTWGFGTRDLEAALGIDSGNLRMIDLETALWFGHFEDIRVTGPRFTASSLRDDAGEIKLIWDFPISADSDPLELFVKAHTTGNAQLRLDQAPAIRSLQSILDIQKLNWESFGLEPTQLMLHGENSALQVKTEQLAIKDLGSQKSASFQDVSLEYPLSFDLTSDEATGRFLIASPTLETWWPEAKFPDLDVSFSATIPTPDRPFRTQVAISHGQDPLDLFLWEMPRVSFFGKTELTSSILAPSGIDGDWEIEFAVNAQGKVQGDALLAENTEANLSLKAPVSIANRSLPISQLLEDILPKTTGYLSLSADAWQQKDFRAAIPQINLEIQEAAISLSLSSAMLSGNWPLSTEDFSARGTINLEDSTEIKSQIDAGLFVENTLLELSAESSTRLDNSARPDTTVHWQIHPFTLIESPIIETWFPMYSGIRTSGIWTAESTIELKDGLADASLSLALDSGSFLYPASNVTGTGITARLELDSLRAFSGTPRGNQMSARSIAFGDIETTEWNLQWDWVSGELARMNTASFNLLDGTASLAPSTLSLRPFSIDSEIRLDSLDLGEMGEMVETFDGKLEGQIEGTVPFTFRNGKFVPREAFIGLTEGSQAKLFYNSRVFTPLDTEQAVFGEKVLMALALEPRQVINDALADLTIDTFEMDLFSQKTPDIPLKINISGEGRSGDIQVPMLLEIPIRGSLTAFYNFMIRLSSMSPTIE